MLKQEIIKQYIATLKEDNELDYIFPLLLKQMGYRVLLTPKQSKGQPQYGRDVVAAKNVDGVDTLFLFELKGFSAKDITDRTLDARDGIIESLNASKNTKYRDASISGLSKCPRIYVFVHNGYAEANALLTLNDYVEENFPEGSFDRWDLDKLTTLFSEYLFDETLLTDEESYRLFKKVLVLLDSEGDNFKDIVSLVEKATEAIDEKEAEKTAKKMQQGKFDLEDFLSSMKQIKKLGPLENLLKLIPGAKKMGLSNIQIDPKQMARIEAIVLSMTPKERKNPDIIKSSRKMRIAKGSGTSVQEVNRLLQQFDQMKRMMKQFSNGNMKLPF